MLVVLGSLMLVPLGTAGSSLLDVYGGNGSKEIVAVKSAHTTTPQQTTTQPQTAGAGTLPFTGSDLAIFVVVGASLTLIGATLRRVGRNEN